MKKCEELLQKNGVKIGIGIFTILFSTYILAEYLAYKQQVEWISIYFSKDRMIMVIIAIIFIALVCSFKWSWTCDKLFRYRYLLCFSLLTYLVINGYHGSSIANYEYVIQPNNISQENLPFLGESRSIRSDEFIVDTPSVLAQVIGNPALSKYNSILHGTETLVTLFPLLPTLTLSILLKPTFLAYLVLPLEQAFSLSWYAPYFALFMSSFELFRVLTKDKRGYSCFGAALITLSPGILWWGQPLMLIYGIIATLAFHLFLKSEKWQHRLLSSMLIGWMGACYVATLYPAWMIPYGYFFLILFIWLFYKNYKQKRWNKKYFIYLLPIISIVVFLLAPVLYENLDIISLTSNTVYPGARSETGGIKWQWLFHYAPSTLFAFNESANSSEFSQMLSFYPIPLIMGGIQFIKNWKSKKHDLLLNLLLIVICGLTLWNYVSIGPLAKLTLLSMSAPSRSQLSASVACVFLLIYYITNYTSSNENLNKRKLLFSSIGGIITTFLLIQICREYLDEYMTKLVIIYIVVVFTPLFIFLYMNTKNTKKYFVIITSVVLVVQAIWIMPMTKGLGALTDKPLIQEAKNIIDDNESTTWLVDSLPIYFQSALIANGIPVLNSTSHYPDFDFWYTIDPTRENEDIYNRYCHVAIIISDSETSFELTVKDMVTFTLNVNDLKKINVDYIVSSNENLEDLSTQSVVLEKMYQEDGSIIYKVN